MSSNDDFCKQFVWTQISPDKSSALFWIQTVWHSDGIPERIVRKGWFLKKISTRQNYMKKFQGGKEFKSDFLHIGEIYQNHELANLLVRSRCPFNHILTHAKGKTNFEKKNVFNLKAHFAYSCFKMYTLFGNQCRPRSAGFRIQIIIHPHDTSIF